MTQKQILAQTQGVQSNSISPIKRIAWASLMFDDIKITVDAYNGMGTLAEPRKDSLIEVVTEKQCYELSPETLIKAIDYYYGMNSHGSEIISYKNRKHVLVTDFYKKQENARIKAESGLKI